MKLLDFGIAKLLDETQDRQAGRQAVNDADDAGGIPETGSSEPSIEPAPEQTVWLLTPEYACPEQFLGEPITVASDVYQLGLVLHLLLTGRKAIDLRDAAVGTWAAIVCGRKPKPPSTVAKQQDGPVGPRRLAGDLDAIVGRALRKSPRDRYQSVAALADDLRRHLASRPVGALPASWPYLVRKFVRRHTAGVVIGIVALVLLVSLSMLHARRLAQERDAARAAARQAEEARAEADQNRREAEEVSEFLVRTFQVADPRKTPGASVTARQLLDQSAARIREELADQPRTRAKLLRTMAVTYRNLGLNDEAAELLKDVAELHEGSAGDLGDAVDRIETFNLMSSIRWRQLRPGEARQWAERAMEELDGRTQGADAAQTFRRLGNLEMAGGRWGDAAEWYRRALDAAPQRDSMSLNNLGVALFESGRLDEAEAIHRENLGLRRAAFGAVHNDVGQSVYNLGEVRLARGDPGAALEHFRESVEIYIQVYPDSHSATAEALRGAGRAHEALARWSEAVEAHREALWIRQRVFDAANPSIAQSLLDLARSLHALGQDREARSHAEDARRIFDVHPVAARADRIRSRVLLAEIHLDAGRLDEVADVLEPVSALRRDTDRHAGDVHENLEHLATRLREAGLEDVADGLEMTGPASD